MVVVAVAVVVVAVVECSRVAVCVSSRLYACRSCAFSTLFDFITKPPRFGLWWSILSSLSVTNCMLSSPGTTIRKVRVS